MNHLKIRLYTYTHVNISCLIFYIGKLRTIFQSVSEFLSLMEVVTLIVLVLTPLNRSELWIRQYSSRTAPPHPQDSDCISTWFLLDSLYSGTMCLAATDGRRSFR